jgi:hypothetical protein
MEAQEMKNRSLPAPAGSCFYILLMLLGKIFPENFSEND